MANCSNQLEMLGECGAGEYQSHGKLLFRNAIQYFLQADDVHKRRSLDRINNDLHSTKSKSVERKMDLKEPSED